MQPINIQTLPCQSVKEAYKLQSMFDLSTLSKVSKLSIITTTANLTNDISYLRGIFSLCSLLMPPTDLNYEIAITSN